MEIETQPTSAVETIKRTRAKRVSITLDEAGKADLDAMDTARKEKIQFAVDGTLLTGKQGAQNLEQKGKQFEPFIAPLAAIIAQAEVLIAAKSSRIPTEIIEPCFAWSPQEIQTIEGPAARVIAKRAGLWLSENIEEYTLGLYLVQITNLKIQSFQKVAAQYRAEKAKEQPKTKDAKPNGSAADVTNADPRS